MIKTKKSKENQQKFRHWKWFTDELGAFFFCLPFSWHVYISVNVYLCALNDVSYFHSMIFIVDELFAFCLPFVGFVFHLRSRSRVIHIFCTATQTWQRKKGDRWKLFRCFGLFIWFFLRFSLYFSLSCFLIVFAVFLCAPVAVCQRCHFASSASFFAVCFFGCLSRRLFFVRFSCVWLIGRRHRLLSVRTFTTLSLCLLIRFFWVD